MFAEHLDEDTKQWEDKSNDMVAAAKKMAKLMKQISESNT